MVNYLKTKPVRSEAYRRYVAALPCYRCGVYGMSQAAHGDAGKGLGIKSSDLTCYPLCATRIGEPGCHMEVGSMGVMSRDERREFEKKAAEDTQKELIALSWEDWKLRALLKKLEVVK